MDATTVAPMDVAAPPAGGSTVGTATASTNHFLVREDPPAESRWRRRQAPCRQGAGEAACGRS